MIKKIIKYILKSNKYTEKIYILIRDIKGSVIFKEKGNKKHYPQVLQMPITTKCNSKCIMCNIPNMDKSNEMTSKEFGTALKDDIFKEVTSIGINGGEPFLLSDLEDYVEQAIVNLPKLKYINIISNGFLTKRIIEKTKKIYSICKKNNIVFEIMFSLDGYGEIHDKVRGIPGAFNNVTATITNIYENISEYADRIELACTVVKENVDYLVELDTYCKLKNYHIKYRLGIENERIGNIGFLDEFSVLNDINARQTATEFFYTKFLETKDYKYYSIYRFLAFKDKRMMGCTWKENGITMNPKGDLFYCAVASKKLGNIKDKKGKEIFFDADNLKYRQRLICDSCDKCIHDYSGKPLLKDVFKFYSHIIKNRESIKKYKRMV